jgi:hypothetical protein
MLYAGCRIMVMPLHCLLPFYMLLEYYKYADCGFYFTYLDMYFHFLSYCRDMDLSYCEIYHLML